MISAVCCLMSLAVGWAWTCYEGVGSIPFPVRLSKERVVQPWTATQEREDGKEQMEIRVGRRSSITRCQCVTQLCRG